MCASTASCSPGRGAVHTGQVCHVRAGVSSTGASRRVAFRVLRRRSSARRVFVVCDSHAVASVAHVERGLIARLAFRAERRVEEPVLGPASAGPFGSKRGCGEPICAAMVSTRDSSSSAC
jgi:hypothetical protein